MRLDFREIPDWPKLCWAARVDSASSSARVLHGPCVETDPLWCVEAVWPGTYEKGDFDRSDVVVGTGLRVREDSIVFVSSSDTLNRLLYYEDDNYLHVSNSLPALLAVADLSLLSHYDYVAIMTSIVNGVPGYEREIVTDRFPVRQLYFNNLVVTNSGVKDAAKPSAVPDFEDFATYYDYLLTIARRCGENSASASRRHKIVALATISKGYDSPATAVLAREAGARHAATIANARRVASNLFNIDDSGAGIASRLGFTAAVGVSRRAKALKIIALCSIRASCCILVDPTTNGQEQ